MAAPQANVTRAAIYARFSTDLQSERSIDDQIALCRGFAEREGMAVVLEHRDRAKSGASILGRDGLIALMVAAKARAFDVLLVEHTDRIARSMRDLADVHEKLAFYGIAIRAVHSGATMDTAMIGLFGLVGQMQREDGAKKVRRGMAGVVRGGRHAGGRAYGYRPVPGKPGELAIDAAEAAIVRRIFAAYVDGATARDIASALNRDAVAPPRGRAWNASTINGNAARGSGILKNDLYAGQIVWNKVRMVKDPETGRRISRPNVEAEHQRAAAPHLAIVDPAIFAAAMARKAVRARLKPEHRQRPRRLLSGLLKCGACGGGMVAHDRDRAGKVRVRCSAVRESGTCGHKRTYYAEAIEAATMRGLREKLRDPRWIAEYVREYRAERKRLAGDRASRRVKLETRLGEIGREIERLVDALAKGAALYETIAARMGALEAERREARAALEAMTTDDIDVVTLHPAAVTTYLAQIDALSESLREGRDADQQFDRSFRALVHSVTVHPVPAKAPLDIEVRGYLAALTNDPRMQPSYRVCGFEVVAEEGLEPPTRGL